MFQYDTPLSCYSTNSLSCELSWKHAMWPKLHYLELRRYAWAQKMRKLVVNQTLTSHISNAEADTSQKPEKARKSPKKPEASEPV